jgi:hypothetical protein
MYKCDELNIKFLQKEFTTGDNNDSQQVNNVPQFEFVFTKGVELTVIHGCFENWKHRQNIVGHVTWSCCQFQAMKYLAMIKTAGNCVI